MTGDWFFFVVLAALAGAGVVDIELWVPAWLLRWLEPADLPETVGRNCSTFEGLSDS